MIKKEIICFIAGKSGGHIVPCLTLAKKYKEEQQCTILFCTTTRALDKYIIATSDSVDYHLTQSLGAFSYTGMLGKIRMLKHCFMAFMQSIYIVIRYRPSRVITSGGIIAIPLCIVSNLLKIPVIMYELNAVPGKATLFLSSFAQTIYVCFDVAKKWFKRSVLLTEYPLRSMQFSVRKNSDRCTIAILGGSQGSIQLNTIFLQWLEQNEIYYKNIRLFHQTGSIDTRNWKDIYASKLIEATTFEYTQSIESIYSQADIIICRGGAGTLFEILHCNKRAIVIPLEHVTTNHQWDNAVAMATTYPAMFSVFREKEIIADMQPFNELLSSIITQESKWHEDHVQTPMAHPSIHE